MKIYCAWCDGLIAEGSDPAPGAGESGGLDICPSCREMFVGSGQHSLDRFLDRLPAPVLLVNDRAGVLLANRRAQRALGKDDSLIRGRLTGEVLECVHSRLPGGCGQTIHCQACQIRRSVAETYRTGQPLWKIPACLHADRPPPFREAELLVSTEKIGELVLLRIDNLG